MKEEYGNRVGNIIENGVNESVGIVILLTLRIIFIFSLAFSPYTNFVQHLFHGRVNALMCRLPLVRT